MAKGDSLFRRTGKTLSVLFFETTKHSRIMKKRMRIGGLQKKVKADYRDLGILVYDALLSGKDASFLTGDETKALVENISALNREMERLREGIARIARAKKYFHDSPGPGGPEAAPERKRSFLGLKKRKAAAELAKMAARDLAASLPPEPPSPAEPGEAGKTPPEPVTPPAKPEKAKRSFFGFKKKKAKPQQEETAGKPAEKKAKRGFLGLRKKAKPAPEEKAVVQPPAAVEKEAPVQEQTPAPEKKGNGSSSPRKKEKAPKASSKK